MRPCAEIIFEFKKAASYFYVTSNHSFLKVGYREALDRPSPSSNLTTERILP